MTNTMLLALMCGFIAVGGVQSLDTNDVTEGSCINAPAASNVDIDWFGVPRMWTNSGGSKYFLYRISAGYPGFLTMRDFEFYYDSCLQVWWDIPANNVTVYGFGEDIGSYDVNPIKPETTEFTAKPPVPGAGEKFTSTITLTDNKTFAFVVKCFTGANQRAWDVFTVNPSIVTPEFQEMIEEHAISLGFDRQNFVFLRYNSCKNILH